VKKLSILSIMLFASVFSFAQEDGSLRSLLFDHREAIGGIDSMLLYSTAQVEYNLTRADGSKGQRIALYGEIDLFRYTDIVGESYWRSYSFDGNNAYRFNRSTDTALIPYRQGGTEMDDYIFQSTRGVAQLFPLFFAERLGAVLELKSRTPEKIVIEATYQDKVKRTFELNASFLLVRDTIEINREASKYKIRSNYSSFQKFKGIRMPRRIAVEVEGGLVDSGEATSLKSNYSLVMMAIKGGVKVTTSSVTYGAPKIVSPGETARIDDLTFTHSEYITTGDDPESLKAADINGDGNIDLLSGDDGGISYLLGSSSGLFPLRLGLPGGGGSNEFALPVDLNNDGLLDIAVASTGAPGETLFTLLNEGNNRFSAPIATKTGDFPESIAAADFNGDNLIDLAIAHNRSGDIWVHYGDGQGNFPQNQQLALQRRGENVAVADFNNDGRPDILAVDQQNLYLFLCTETGNFGEAKIYPAGKLPFCVAALDIDRDGNQDVIVGNGGIFKDCGQEDLAILKGDGSGGLGEAVFISAGASITAIDITDINGDSLPDVVASSFASHQAVILLNREGTLIDAGTLPASWGPTSIVAADFNGDDLPDIAIANEFDDSVTVWLRRK
jgi:hypothetical protein